MSRENRHKVPSTGVSSTDAKQTYHDACFCDRVVTGLLAKQFVDRTVANTVTHIKLY